MPLSLIIAINKYNVLQNSGVPESSGLSVTAWLSVQCRKARSGNSINRNETENLKGNKLYQATVRMRI